MAESPAVTEALIPPLEPRGESFTAAERRSRDSFPPSGQNATDIAFNVANRDPGVATLVLELLNATAVATLLMMCLILAGWRLSSHVLILCLLTFLLSQRLLGPYPARLRPDGTGAPRLPWHKLALGWSATFVITCVLSPSLVPPGVPLRTALLLWFALTPVTLLIGNHYCELALRQWLNRQAVRQRHIVVGATEVGIELQRRLKTNAASGEFLGYFDYREPGRLPPAARAQWAGMCNELLEFVKLHRVDLIYITLPIAPSPRLSNLVKELRDTTASVFLVPNLLALNPVQPSCSTIQGIPVLSVCDTPFNGTAALSKRIMDVALSLLLLLLASPLLLAIAVRLKCSSPGPVFFKQRRYGLNSEEIYVYKFRTMTVSEDGAVVKQATQNDCRVTPFGRILRRSSLDELPQLWNVLQGNMSLVGPRPHAVVHNEQYRKLIDGYMIRHKVRPGITGLAQVNGFRGETDTLEKMSRRVEYDIEYLNHWSLGLDLKILMRTVSLVIRDRFAY